MGGAVLGPRFCSLPMGAMEGLSQLNDNSFNLHKINGKAAWHGDTPPQKSCTRAIEYSAQDQGDGYQTISLNDTNPRHGCGTRKCHALRGERMTLHKIGAREFG